MRTLSLSLLALVAPALFSAACGKDINEHPPAITEFAHSFPEAPRQLTQSNAPAWLAGKPIAATADALYVVDRDNQAVTKLDRKSMKTVKSVKLGAKPEQLVVGPNGDVLVTVRGAGEVARYSADLELLGSTKIGTETFGIALSPDGRTAYVTMPFEDQIVTLDAATLEELDRDQTNDRPRGVTASQSGFVLVVHQHDAAARYPVDEDGLLDTVSVSPVSLRGGNPQDFIDGSRLGGLHATRAIAAAVSPETGAAYVSHVLAAPGTESDFVNSDLQIDDQPTVSSGGYGSTAIPGATVTLPTRPVEVAVTGTDSSGFGTITESEFPVQDGPSGEPLTHLVDQPVDVAHHPTWSLLFVAGYGTDSVLVLSTAEGDPMRSPVGVISVGQAPRGIAFSPDGKTAYVLNEASLTVSEIDVTPFMTMKTFENPGVVQPGGSDSGMATGMATPMPSGAMEMDSNRGGGFASSDPTPTSLRVEPIRVHETREASYGKDPMSPELRRGARVFTFARNKNISHAGQFACASCHFEGTEDKLTWFIPDGPRQTPALAGRLLGTAPFNWNGSRDALQSNMVQTVERMGGDGLTKQELSDLEQFLVRGLEVPKNPNLALGGELTAEQQAGEEIFNGEVAACASCHRPGQAFTDGLDHDVGTANQLEVARFEVERATKPGEEIREPGMLNTPTLKGLFYTAPYLHDGAAKTLYDVLERTKSTMGHSENLTYEQKKALVAYLMTL